MFLCPVCSEAEAHRRKHVSQVQRTTFHHQNHTHLYWSATFLSLCVIKMPPFGKGKLNFNIYREDRMHNISTVCLLCFS